MCGTSALAMTATATTRFLLDASEAADLLRVSVRTIRRWVTAGRLPATRTTLASGGKLLVKRTDLLASVGITDEPVAAPAPAPAPRRGRRPAAAAAAEVQA